MKVWIVTQFGAEPASEWKDWGELRDQLPGRHFNMVQLKYDAEMLGDPTWHSAFIRNNYNLNVHPVPNWIKLDASLPLE